MGSFIDIFMYIYCCYVSSKLTLVICQYDKMLLVWPWILLRKPTEFPKIVSTEIKCLPTCSLEYLTLNCTAEFLECVFLRI